MKRIVTVSEKGQVVIPADLRRRLGIEPGCKLEIAEEGPALRLVVHRHRVSTTIADGYRMLAAAPAESRRLADFDVAAAMREDARP